MSLAFLLIGLPAQTDLLGGLTAYRQLAEEMVPETEAEKKDEAEAMHTEVPAPVEAPADMDEAELPESDGPETDTGDAL